MHPPSTNGMAHGEYAISSPFVKTIISISSSFFLKLDARVNPAAPAPTITIRIYLHLYIIYLSTGILIITSNHYSLKIWDESIQNILPKVG